MANIKKLSPQIAQYSFPENKAVWVRMLAHDYKSSSLDTEVEGRIGDLSSLGNIVRSCLKINKCIF